MDGYECVVWELEDALIRHLLVESRLGVAGGFMLHGRDIGKLSYSLKDRTLVFFDGQTKICTFFHVVTIINSEVS